MDQLPRLGKRELICLLLFTCNYVVFVRRGFLFLWVLGMGYVILLWQSLSLTYNYITRGGDPKTKFRIFKRWTLFSAFVRLASEKSAIIRSVIQKIQDRFSKQ